jgi:cytochrome P450
MNAVNPPTIKRRGLLGSLREFHRDAFNFLLSAAREHGDIVLFYLGPRRVYLISRPEDVRDVLVTNSGNFIKGPGQQQLRAFIGEGLLTSEGEFHSRQRRLVQPAFHRQRIREYGRSMVDYSARARERWREGQIVDVGDEMTQLTLAIVTKSLFGDEADEETAELAQALVMQYFQQITRPLPRLMSALPLPSNFRTKATIRRLDAIIYRMINERRRLGTDRGDLLSMLIAATDEEDPGTGMTDKQVRDELVTLLMAGHETMSSALPWTWYLLSQNPEVEARMHAEIDQALNGRLPTADDYPQLKYVEMVFNESMRLYPPTWAIAREAVKDYQLDRYTVPARSLVCTSPYIMHRDPRYYPDPLKFDPERWTPEAKALRPKFTFFPFGAGSRQCIGEGFAWMEAVLLITTIAQKWQLQLAPGETVVARPSPGLRVKKLRMVAHDRQTSGNPAARISHVSAK